MEGGKGTVKGVALIIRDNNVRGSLHFVQDPNGSFSLSSYILVSLLPLMKHEIYVNSATDAWNIC